MSFTPFPDEVDHKQPSTNASRTDIAKHFGFWNLNDFIGDHIRFKISQKVLLSELKF